MILCLAAKGFARQPVGDRVRVHLAPAIAVPGTSLGRLGEGQTSHLRSLIVIYMHRHVT